VNVNNYCVAAKNGVVAVDVVVDVDVNNAGHGMVEFWNNY
jgi:hypothetical protein